MPFLIRAIQHAAALVWHAWKQDLAVFMYAGEDGLYRYHIPMPANACS